MRVIAGLERAAGVVRVGSECWQDDARRIFLPTHKRAVGYVFQDVGLFPHVTVRGNLEYGRKRCGAAASDEEVGALVHLLGIEHLLDRSPEHLSGGERQRVAIGRALCARPRLLLMDEPLAALDARRKAEILPYLGRLQDELSIPTIYVSHVLDEVARLANHLVVLDDGVVKASGPTTATLARLDLPLAHSDDGGVVIDAQVALHDEADHLTRADLSGGFLWIGRVDRPCGAPIRVRVLARDVSLARERPGTTSILNVLAARVVELSDDGPDRVNVRLAVGGEGAPLLSRITRRSRDVLSLSPGVEVYAMVKSVAIVA